NGDLGVALMEAIQYGSCQGTHATGRDEAEEHGGAGLATYSPEPFSGDCGYVALPERALLESFGQRAAVQARRHKGAIDGENAVAEDCGDAVQATLAHASI